MKQYNASDDAISLRYWQAVITFGRIAVDTVLGQILQADQFPELARSMGVREDGSVQTSGAIILPGEVVFNIASNEHVLYDYISDPSRTILGGIPKDQSSRNLEAQNWERMSSMEALLKYGAYCLFQSEDRGTGMCRERDPQRFPMFKTVVQTATGKTIHYVERPNDPPWRK